MSGETHCPLCSEQQIVSYHTDRRRSYLRCQVCELVFVPREYLPGRELERAEYDLHQNDIYDSGYRKFLSRLAVPLVARLAPGAQGLDFGCGPGPALALMLREEGLQVSLYDSFYHPDETVFDDGFDFICATEVVEHLHHPRDELERLWSLLRPGGCLGVMTKLVLGREAFSSWHYKNDPTHVCFFSAATWRWWAARYSASLEIIGADVILLGKS